MVTTLVTPRAANQGARTSRGLSPGAAAPSLGRPWARPARNTTPGSAAGCSRPSKQAWADSAKPRPT
eukprot:6220474-Lingulodinium_polyedra.AAC.1